MEVVRTHPRGLPINEKQEAVTGNARASVVLN